MKLFRLTKNRRMILEEVATDLFWKKDRCGPGSLSRMIREEIGNADTKDLDEKWQSYSEALTILNLIRFHSDEVFRKTQASNPMGWENEWDVPHDLFQKKMDFIIEEQKRNARFADAFELEKRIDLINRLKLFRSQSGSGGK